MIRRGTGPRTMKVMMKTNRKSLMRASGKRILQMRQKLTKKTAMRKLMEIFPKMWKPTENLRKILCRMTGNMNPKATMKMIQKNMTRDMMRKRILSPVRYSSKSARPELKIYVPAAEPDEEPVIPVRRKKHKGLKICGLLLAMFVVVAGCAYAGISYYYSDRFFQGTWINGIDCSGKTAYETELALSEKIQDYSIQVSARNQEPQVITGDQINYQYLSTGETLSLLKNQKPYEWIKGFYQRKSYTVSENTYYDRTLLQNQVTSLNCARTENRWRRRMHTLPIRIISSR